jgi:hypothetical protein
MGDTQMSSKYCAGRREWLEEIDLERPCIVEYPLDVSFMGQCTVSSRISHDWFGMS